MNKLIIKKIEGDFTVCKVTDIKNIDINNKFTFLSTTDDEISLVCLTENTPENTTHREDNWKCMRIEGILDFSLIGIIADISRIFSENKIGIFVISTYNTDYVLVKAENYKNALIQLKNNGYIIEDQNL